MLEDVYTTKDQDEIAWLLLYNPDVLPTQIVEPRPVERDGKVAFTEYWFHFPDRERQEQLIHEYSFSRERDFAMKRKDINRFIRSYK